MRLNREDCCEESRGFQIQLPHPKSYEKKMVASELPASPASLASPTGLSRMLASFSMASPAPFRCLQWHIRQRPSRPARLLAKAAKDDSRWRPLSLSEKLQQPLQLLVAIWLLLLLPAGLAMSPRKICGGLVLGTECLELNDGVDGFLLMHGSDECC